ncbi:MAG: KAP family NTPase [Prolixibacteraceae bacterium]|nr:KAP family NTPase [Prolixibacteraceae bacterium]
MKLKHHDIPIDAERPFANCKLGREQYANILTSLVGSYADGFVLAINNEWGTGKTTFVKMWQQQLNNQGFKTLYFNAWENDFENGALAALMSELSTLQERGTKSLFKKVLAKGAILTKSAIPILLKAAASKYLDKEVLKELFEGMADNANELLQTQIQEYTSKKEGLKEFRTSLEEFVKKSTEDKPIVFIIDELDRCRPDYAVDVLEKVKHFFGVPGIVFVLSIDKVQLGHAVRGVYGSESLNADEYLRRFIDLEYAIPEPSTEMFCKYLFEYFDFGKFFKSSDRWKHGELRNDPVDFLNMSIQLFKNDKLTLRQQEKILAHARIALNSFHPNNYLFPELFLVLIYFKVQHLNFYQQIRVQKLNIQELINGFESFIPKSLSDDELRTYIFVEAQLVYFFNNYINHGAWRSLYGNDEDGKKKILYNSTLTTGGGIFEEIIERYSNNSNITGLKISFLIDRIDLMEDIRVS